MRLRYLVGLILLALPVAGADPCPKLKPGVALENLFHPCRPEAAGAAERERAVRSLPARGEVKGLSRGEEKKLAALEAVLRLHERVGVYAVKVVDLDAATTALHGRAVLIITHPALALLTAEELQALVAHEIGHEYVWEEFAAARGDMARRRELELICDTIAAETLRRLGVRAEWLYSALRKVEEFNRERMGVGNGEAYPALAERRGVIGRVVVGGLAH